MIIFRFCLNFYRMIFHNEFVNVAHIGTKRSIRRKRKSGTERGWWSERGERRPRRDRRAWSERRWRGSWTSGTGWTGHHKRWVCLYSYVKIYMYHHVISGFYQYVRFVLIKFCGINMTAILTGGFFFGGGVTLIFHYYISISLKGHYRSHIMPF